MGGYRLQCISVELKAICPSIAARIEEATVPFVVYGFHTAMFVAAGACIDDVVIGSYQVTPIVYQLAMLDAEQPGPTGTVRSQLGFVE